MPESIFVVVVVVVVDFDIGFGFSGFITEYDIGILKKLLNKILKHALKESNRNKKKPVKAIQAW